MSAPAGIYDIVADQGATFQRVLTWKDSTGANVNLTGYSARMQVRRRPSDGEALVSLTTQNGRITLGGAAGTITLNCPASEMDFVDGDGKNFNWGINFHECAVHKFYKKHGGGELLPYVCMSDYAVYEHFTNVEFRRTQILAKGAKYCDFR